MQAQKEKKPAAHAPTQTSPEKLQRKGIAKEGELIGFLAGAVKGAIVILQPFLGSLGTGTGGPGSHGAMQKPTRAFGLVAHNENSKARERNLNGRLVGSASPFRAVLWVFGCQPLMFYGNLFPPVVRIP
jgi:hypothetical protein